jgi:hypothetical protein
VKAKLPREVFIKRLEEIGSSGRMQTSPAVATEATQDRLIMSLSSAMLSLVNNTLRVAGIEVEDRYSEVNSEMVDELIARLVARPIDAAQARLEGGDEEDEDETTSSPPPVDVTSPVTSGVDPAASPFPADPARDRLIGRLAEDTVGAVDVASSPPSMNNLLELRDRLVDTVEVLMIQSLRAGGVDTEVIRPDIEAANGLRAAPVDLATRYVLNPVDRVRTRRSRHQHPLRKRAVLKQLERQVDAARREIDDLGREPGA